MGTATNFVVFDKSFQAASLGDASLIAIVTTKAIVTTIQVFKVPFWMAWQYNGS